MEIKELDKESFNLHLVIAHPARDIIQINSPEKIDKEILIDFRNRSKPVKLITLDKKEWVTRVIHFDKEFLFVRIPSSELKSQTGTLILVEFPTVKGNYIIQTFVHQVKSPMLCLQFQNPRIDTRYLIPSTTPLCYVKVNQDFPWVRDINALVVRTTGHGPGKGKNIIIKETIKISQRDNEGADGDIDISSVDMLNGELENISLGGCAFIAHGEEITPDSLMYLTIELRDIKDGSECLQLSLFAIICYTVSRKENQHTYGVRFLRRLIHEPLNEFFNNCLKSYD